MDHLWRISQTRIRSRVSAGTSPAAPPWKSAARRQGAALVAQLVGDAQALVPLRHALGARERADLQLLHAPADGQVHDGETEDLTIVHLAVGWGVKQLKVGSFARSERMAKWNEGLRIADQLGNEGGALPPRGVFPWGRGR